MLAGLVTLAFVSATLGFSVPSSSEPWCPREVREVLGFCPEPTTDGTNVNIDGTHTTDGTHIPDPDVTTPTWNPDSPGTWTPPETWSPEDFAECQGSWDFLTCFRRFSDDDETDDEDDGTDIPPITISDVARFTPAPTTVSGEPDDVGIAGMPANFVAAASVTTQEGTFFGHPISVRFTPSAFVFRYGDGTEATTSTGGRTWTELGQAQFTPTETSHVYATRGTYAADVDVRYAAEVDFGLGWFPLSGEVTADGPAREIRIFDAHTALVAHTCEQKPSSPGC